MNFLQTSKKSITQLLRPNLSSPLTDVDDYANTNWKHEAWSTVGSVNPLPFKIKLEHRKASLWTCVGARRPAQLWLSSRLKLEREGLTWAKMPTSPTPALGWLWGGETLVNSTDFAVMIWTWNVPAKLIVWKLGPHLVVLFFGGSGDFGR